MSTVISISTFVQPQKYAEAFTEIVKRLSNDGEGIALNLYRGHSGPDARVTLDSSAIESIDMLAGQTVNSRDCLVARVRYSVLSNGPIGVQVRLFGTQYEGGLAVRDNGHIQTQTTINDLGRRLWNFVYDRNLKGDGCNEQQALDRDSERLFFDLCLRGEGEFRPSVRHAAVYLEYGCPSPAGCSMVFHRSVHEVAYDLLRIYAEYQFGTLIPATLDDTVQGDWERTFGGVRGIPGKDRPEFYKQFSASGVEIARFLDSLDEERMRRILALSESAVRKWFAENDLSLLNTRYHEFGDGSIALTTNPLLSLWPVYDHLYSSIV